MKCEGNIYKMRVELDNPVKYYFLIGEKEIFLNKLIEKEIIIKYLNQINCIRCGRITKTSFAQGYCYPCFRSAPETEECVLRPELCEAHNGIARDMEYAKEHCLIDHYVYLAITSGLKVGVTRHTQIPTRWIDQGAVKAFKIAKTPNRHIAGLIEVELKKYLADKTNWRNMLMNKFDVNIDFIKTRENILDIISHTYKEYILNENIILTINYPVVYYPDKVKSINLDKVKQIEGKISGIKGQYLILDGGTVFNVRNYSGYYISLEY